MLTLLQLIKLFQKNNEFQWFEKSIHSIDSMADLLNFVELIDDLFGIELDDLKVNSLFRVINNGAWQAAFKIM